MKKILIILTLLFTVTSCSNNKIKELEEENKKLKSQINLYVWQQNERDKKIEQFKNKKLGIDDVWEVPDLWTLKINYVKKITVDHFDKQFIDKMGNIQEAIAINYSYTNLGYIDTSKPNIDSGIKLEPYLVIDDNGVIAEWYPDFLKSPITVPYEATQEGAETIYLLKSNSSKVTIKFKALDYEATFEIDITE